MFKVKRGDFVQGKQQWLRFARAAVKRYPTSKVTETPSKMVGVKRGHQRADTLQPQTQTTNQSDHTDHSLSNSMKLRHAVWGYPRRTAHSGEV